MGMQNLRGYCAPDKRRSPAACQALEETLRLRLRASREFPDSARGLDGKEPADVFPQQLREALVEVGADGDVTLVALVGGGELGDHAVALFQRVALELHGARLQSAIGRDHQEAQSGFTTGGAVVGEVLARGLQRAGPVSYTHLRAHET